MKRHVVGLSQAALPENDADDGLYLVRVERASYRWDKTKPHYAVRFSVVEPKQLASTSLSGRLYCTEKALWKLSWFLRDFGYDAEMLGRDELDDKHIVGLIGVVKISHTTVNGRSYLNLDAFAAAGQWDQVDGMRPTNESDGVEPEVA